MGTLTLRPVLSHESGEHRGGPLPWLARAALLLALALPASTAGAQFDLFSWTVTKYPSGVSGSASVAGDTLTATGPTYPDPCLGGGAVYATTTAPFDATVTVRLAFTPEAGPGDDMPITVINGVEHPLPEPCNGCDVVFHVKAGDSFGFGNHSLDCVFTAAVSVFSELRLHPEPQGATVAGSSAFESFGQALADVGDLDFDGVHDVAVGAPNAEFNGPQSGRVVVLSGGDGSVLFAVNGPAAGMRFGFAVDGAGDVNHDGVPDLIVGAPDADFAGQNAGRFYLLSGAGGAILGARDGDNPSANFGHSVAGVGDVTADGTPDLLIGAPGSSMFGLGAGRAVAVSGVNAATIFNIGGTGPGVKCGLAVAGAGDLDADGVPDLLVGSPFESTGRLSEAGRVRAHSGADGHTLFALDGGGAEAQFGAVLAAIADLDDDGVPDFAVGAPTADTTLSAAGRVSAHSGATGAELFGVVGTSTLELLGRSLADAGDVDGDGRSDLLAGAYAYPGIGPNPSSTARLLSGRDGSLLTAFDGAQIGQDAGSAVAGLGDIDGDGQDDVVVGAPGTDVPPQDAGSVTFYTQLEFLWTDFGGALAGQAGAPHLAGQSVFAAGGPFALSVHDALPQAPLTLVAGFTLLGAPFKGGVLWPAPDFLRGGFVVDSAGQLTLATAWPAGVPSGFELFLQAWIQELSPGDFSATNGLKAQTP
jgi:hypothetical protein